MKTINKILITVLLVNFGFLTHAQINKTKISNRTIDSKSLSTGSNAISKLNVASVNAVVTNKNVNLAKFTQLKVSDKDLARKALKSSKITPLRPYTPALSVDYFGNYSKSYFELSPKGSTGLEPLLLAVSHPLYEQVVLNSGTVLFNARRDKEYRIKFITDLDKNGFVAVRLGNQIHWLRADKNSNEINFVFELQQAGYVKIQISALLLDLSVPYNIETLKIKSIRVDEI